MYSERLSEQLAIVAAIDPDAYTTGDQNSDAVDMSKFNRAMFLVMAGTLGSSGTVDFKLQWSETSGGSYSDISGKAITQLTQAGSDDDKQVIVEITAEELAEVDTTARFVRGVLTIGTATSDAAMIALAGVPRQHPASDDDLASVDEIVT